MRHSISCVANGNNIDVKAAKMQVFVCMQVKTRALPVRARGMANHLSDETTQQNAFSFDLLSTAKAVYEACRTAGMWSYARCLWAHVNMNQLTEYPLSHMHTAIHGKQWHAHA